MTVLGRLLIVFCITFSTTLSAQDNSTSARASQELNETTPEERIADLERRNDELRYGLDVARIHVDLVDRQTSWFSILISGFALVVTVLIVGFGFRVSVREASSRGGQERGFQRSHRRA